MLTDQEIIATWMEPKPRLNPERFVRLQGVSNLVPCPDPQWWCLRLTDSLQGTEWRPIPITLNECHLVEKRLSESQWATYDYVLTGHIEGYRAQRKALLHAPAETRITALAAVLREEVERG